MKRPILLALGICIPCLAAAALPGDAVLNGRFETGLAEWAVGGSPACRASFQWISPGAGGSNGAVRNVFCPGGSDLYQSLPPGLTPAIAAFDAYIEARPASTRPQALGIYSAPNPNVPSERLLLVSLGGDGRIGMSVFTGEHQIVASVTTDAWHHFEIALTPPLFGTLLIDGQYAGTVASPTGTPVNAGSVWFGDAWGGSTLLAPDVRWDNVYVGPAL